MTTETPRPLFIDHKLRCELCNHVSTEVHPVLYQEELFNICDDYNACIKRHKEAEFELSKSPARNS